jgi:hypothetical protein
MRNKRVTGCSRLLIANKISSRCAVMCCDVKGTHYLNCHLLGFCSPLPPPLSFFFLQFNLSVLTYPFFISLSMMSVAMFRKGLTYLLFPHIRTVPLFQWCSAACLQQAPFCLFCVEVLCPLRSGFIVPYCKRSSWLPLTSISACGHQHTGTLFFDLAFDTNGDLSVA